MYIYRERRMKRGNGERARKRIKETVFHDVKVGR